MRSYCYGFVGGLWSEEGVWGGYTGWTGVGLSIRRIRVWYETCLET